jgi:type II secretory pathway component PulC
LAQAKNVKLTDGQLVGIVAGSSAKVYVIAANETEPNVFLVGEGWLAPWIVATVYKDKVIWRNTQNDETVTQYLFDES